MNRGVRPWIAVAAILFGCGGDARGPSADGSSDAGQTTSVASSSATGSWSSPTTSTGDGLSAEAGSTAGDDALPDYSDSPCWGEASPTLVYDGRTHTTESVSASCRAEGERVLVYVADALWGSTVDQAAVNGLMHRLERFTPEGSVDPDQGVVANDEAVFGPMDTSRFPAGKLAIFVVDSKGGGDGYLCGWCDYPQLHLDGPRLQPLDGDFSVSIAAHETYHVIHQAYDANESMWVDESLAEAAMTANGFFTDVDWLDAFLAEPDQDWGPGSPGLGDFNYGGALLWGSLLWERGGIPLMTAITAEPADGWAGLDAALDSVGDPRGAWELYLDMMVAIYLDEPARGYGYESFDVPPVAIEAELVAGMTELGSLAAFGIDYHRIVDEGSLTVELTATGAEPVEGVVVVDDGESIRVQRLGPAVALDVARGEEVFVALTAQDAASYELRID